MSAQKSIVYRLTESAIMLAFAAVLSELKIIAMPYGGSVTAFSMLPILIIAYRYGFRWGLVTSFTYSLIQLILGLDNFSYLPVRNFISVVSLIVFDYLLAFLVLSLGALFRRKSWSQGTSLAFAAFVTGILRYLCHAVAGFTAWTGFSGNITDALIYSLSYNATYMIPEIIILVIGAVYVSRLLSFEGATVTRAKAKTPLSVPAIVVSAIGKTAALAALVWDVILIAPTLQNADSGNFTLTGLASVDWMKVGIITAAGLLILVITEIVSARMKKPPIPSTAPEDIH